MCHLPSSPSTRCSASAAAPGGDEWKYDVVHLKSGETLSGLVVEQDAKHVFIRKIVRKPGAPTLIFSDDLKRAEVDHIDLLEGADHDQLVQRIQSLIREREALAAQLKRLDPDASKGQLASEDELTLKPAAVAGRSKAKALAYQSTYFRLISDARPEVVELAAIRLEQVYAAFAHLLPPRVTAPAPTTILLANSLADYKALVAQQGRNLFNPAYFDPAKNQIVCASDIGRLADALERRPPRRRESAGRPQEQGKRPYPSVQRPRARRSNGADTRSPPADQGDSGTERRGVRQRPPTAVAAAFPRSLSRLPVQLRLHSRRRRGAALVERRLGADFRDGRLRSRRTARRPRRQATASTPFTPPSPRGRCCRRPICSAPTTNSFRSRTPRIESLPISIISLRGRWPSTSLFIANCWARRPGRLRPRPQARLGSSGRLPRSGRRTIGGF